MSIFLTSHDMHNCRSRQLMNARAAETKASENWEDHSGLLPSDISAARLSLTLWPSAPEAEWGRSLLDLSSGTVPAADARLGPAGRAGVWVWLPWVTLGPSAPASLSRWVSGIWHSGFETPLHPHPGVPCSQPEGAP